MITLEFLLVFALVILPLGVGLVMLARKAFTVFLNQRTLLDQPYSRAVIWDSAAPARAVGQVIGYDRFEAPLVVFRDTTTQAGIVLGVRPSRFTSVSAVYYSGPDCDGNPYVRATVHPPVAMSIQNYWPAAAFANQLWGLNFAMGQSNILYKQAVGGAPGTQTAFSVWISQDTHDDSPSFGGTACVRPLLPFEIASLYGDGNTAYATTTRDHYLVPGDEVTISDAMPGVFNALGVTVQNVTGPRSFTYIPGAVPGTVVGNASGDTVSMTNPKVTLVSTVNLVSALEVVQFDVPFTPPYRLAYPSPGAAWVPPGPPGPKEGNLP